MPVETELLRADSVVDVDNWPLMGVAVYLDPIVAAYGQPVPNKLLHGQPCPASCSMLFHMLHAIMPAKVTSGE